MCENERSSVVQCCSREAHALSFFFFQAEDGIRDYKVTGVQTCALPISEFPGGKLRRDPLAPFVREPYDGTAHAAPSDCLADLLAQMQAALAGRYTLERELGRGGMATVYLARDVKHDRPVALKVLHPELASTLGPERFQREIKLAARLQHPHILTVLDSGEAA